MLYSIVDVLRQIVYHRRFRTLSKYNHRLVKEHDHCNFSVQYADVRDACRPERRQRTCIFDRGQGYVRRRVLARVCLTAVSRHAARTTRRSTVFPSQSRIRSRVNKRTSRSPVRTTAHKRERAITQFRTIATTTARVRQIAPSITRVPRLSNGSTAKEAATRLADSQSRT